MLNLKKLNELKNKIEKDPITKTRHRMLNKVQLVDLITDSETQIKSEFNINIKTHGITNQQNTGRCWSFAGLNILREKVIENCKLDSFELSGSYIAFYDKLERFNISLERLIKYQEENKNEYDRNISYLLRNGIGDGGYFTQFAELINKYGIVPNYVFPESFSSSNTYEINQILSRLLRKFYLDLEKKQEDITIIKNKYLEQAYIVISNIYGVPPEKFNFEYTDKNGKYHINKNLTPKDFYNKYINIDLTNEYIEITCFNDDIFKYNEIYEQEETSRISGIKDNIILNINPKDFQKLILKQIKAQEVVYFYCSTTSKRIEGIWTDLMDRYGEIFDIDLKLDRNSILKTYGITNGHCMIITGANIIDNKINKWKIENSWGDQKGNKGYYVATDDWMNTYVYRAVINKKHLSKKQLEVLNKKHKKINKWEIKF